MVELWDWTLAPGDAHASEPHVAGARELLSVIEGEVILSVAGEEVVLHPGDAASFHGDVMHGYRNDGSTSARFALTVFEPVAGAAGDDLERRLRALDPAVATARRILTAPGA